MSKMTKVIAALGVVAGLGVAAMPLSSYAAETASANVDVYATVDNSLSIEASKERVDLGPVSVGGVATGATTITVNTTAEKGYNLNIKDSDTETALVKMTADGATVATGADAATIPAGDLTAATSAWGYKTTGDVYSVITTEDKEIFSTAAAGEASTDVTFGVKIGTGQAEGTYKGGVIFTANINS